jgi:hypothetical protein
MQEVFAKTLRDVRRLIPVTLFKSKLHTHTVSSCVNTEVQSYLCEKSRKYEGIIIRDAKLVLKGDGREGYLDVYVQDFKSVLEDDNDATVCIKIASELVTHNPEMLAESLALALSELLANNTKATKATNMSSIIIEMADRFPQILSSKIIDDYYQKTIAVRNLIKKWQVSQIKLAKLHEKQKVPFVKFVNQLVTKALEASKIGLASLQFSCIRSCEVIVEECDEGIGLKMTYCCVPPKVLIDFLSRVSRVSVTASEFIVKQNCSVSEAAYLCLLSLFDKEINSLTRGANLCREIEETNPLIHYANSCREIIDELNKEPRKLVSGCVTNFSEINAVSYAHIQFKTCDEGIANCIKECASRRYSMRNAHDLAILIGAEGNKDSSTKQYTFTILISEGDLTDLREYISTVSNYVFKYQPHDFSPAP